MYVVFNGIINNCGPG